MNLASSPAAATSAAASSASLSRPMPRFLRNALLLDAAASGGLGLLMAAGHAFLAPLLGLPAMLLLGAGLALLPFALGVAALARRATVSRGGVWAVIAINALWVVESFALLGLGWVQPTLLGQVFVVVQAVAVLAFAELEWWGLRRA